MSIIYKNESSSFSSVNDVHKIEKCSVYRKNNKGNHRKTRDHKQIYFTEFISSKLFIYNMFIFNYYQTLVYKS